MTLTDGRSRCGSLVGAPPSSEQLASVVETSAAGGLLRFRVRAMPLPAETASALDENAELLDTLQRWPATVELSSALQEQLDTLQERFAAGADATKVFSPADVARMYARTMGVPSHGGRQNRALFQNSSTRHCAWKARIFPRLCSGKGAQISLANCTTSALRNMISQAPAPPNNKSSARKTVGGRCQYHAVFDTGEAAHAGWLSGASAQCLDARSKAQGTQHPRLARPQLS